MSKMTKGIGNAAAILSSRPMTNGPQSTVDPYLFCVYHKDQYPPGNDEMEAPHSGNGMDFNPDAPYRMYHGSKVPGFPQHPHRGFETITATIDGFVDHADSVGNAGRYGQGDLQWMTAGGGIVHSEMFPLIHQEEDNPTRFFQIWLNLEAKNKMVAPHFKMFWNYEIPKYTTEDGKASVTVWVGHYFGATHENQNSPPPESWASNPENDVALLHITLKPGGKLTLPKANVQRVNRSLFYIEGESDVMRVGGKVIDRKINIHLDESVDVELELDGSAAENGEFLLMQGKPIEEPVAQHGPFVMNTRAEISQAFSDYHETQFGGWPWERDDMIFPREKGRFALSNGKKTCPSPPTSNNKEANDEL
mmetsp:Transcript_1423/g.2114  ORF Transcript_1423/g.2114 Transcript_1423/m.2114 type:complete len:363 (-) Transcript_1423:167-1255(-)